MSQTAQTGYVALAAQTAKGTPATVDGSLALLTTSNSLSGNADRVLRWTREVRDGSERSRFEIDYEPRLTAPARTLRDSLSTRRPASS